MSARAQRLAVVVVAASAVASVILVGALVVGSRPTRKVGNAEPLRAAPAVASEPESATPARIPAPGNSRFAPRAASPEVSAQLKAAAVAPTASILKSSTPPPAPPPVVVQPTVSVAMPLPSAATAAATQLDDEGPAALPREVPRAVLRDWSQVGLCSETGDASAIREQLRGRFRRPENGAASYFVDPRLPEGAEQPVLGFVSEGRQRSKSLFGVEPTEPEVFIYSDKELLRASACIGDLPVAYYDGALHVVATDEQLRESVIHEYAHHALMSSGLLAPAWAQEGLAMLAARETWWLVRSRLEAVRDRPIALEVMERTIPYKLPKDEALTFYIESAMMVACVLTEANITPRDLADALRAGRSASGATRYDLPTLTRSDFFRTCADSLQRRAPRF